MSRETLLEALVQLGRFGSIAKADEGFDPSVPEAKRIVFGRIRPSIPASDMAAFGFSVHTKGSVGGGEAISAEGITQAVRAGALGGQLLAVLGPTWEADQNEDTNAARYCLGSRGSNLWSDDLFMLSLAPAPVDTPGPITPPKPVTDPAADKLKAARLALAKANAEALKKLPQGARGIPAQVARGLMAAVDAVLRDSA